LSINDAGVFGAIAAMEQAGFAPDSVIISSVDAEALAREYIRNGYFMRGSVAISRAEFSRTAVDAMVKLLAGSTLPETIVVPPGDVVTAASLESDGGKLVPVRGVASDGPLSPHSLSRLCFAYYWD